MSNPDEIYQELCRHELETSYLESTSALLDWDQQTQLPEKGDKFRSEQLTFLAGLIHRRKTDPRLGEMIETLVDSPLAADPHSVPGATIRELKRDYDKRVRLPSTLVEELARAGSVGQTIWVQARRENDFSRFAPHLKKIFELKKAQADALGYEDCRYDALLDEYEPGAKTRQVAEVLDALRVELVPLVAEIADSGMKPPTEILHRNYPVEAQAILVSEASTRIGFDYARGRLDVTHHPFCTETGPDDCRITTRYDENFFNAAFFGTLHESGHGLYEQGLRGEFYGLPPGKYCSLGIHESQSRLWENLVGRSLSFWQFFYPRAQELFPDALSDVPLNDFYQAINSVSPSLIRVEADQATYDLHIIIRFQLEQAVINGDLETDDLPAAWNQKYEEYLGVTPDTDAEGVLQDVHWSAGLVGYFPTYSLGNLYASQFFDQCQDDLGDLDILFREGDFLPLKKWLNENVHCSGQCFSGPKLAESVTGETISPTRLIKHLREKLAPIYGL